MHIEIRPGEARALMDGGRGGKELLTVFVHTRPMDLSGIPLFSVLQSKLGYLSEREKVIAQNVANASTPGFTPNDLKPFDKQPGMDPRANARVLAQPARTDAGTSMGAVASSHTADKAKTYLS